MDIKLGNFERDLLSLINATEICKIDKFVSNQHSFRNIITSNNNYIVINNANSCGLQYAKINCNVDNIIKGCRCIYLIDYDINYFKEKYTDFKDMFIKHERVTKKLRFRNASIVLKKMLNLENYHQIIKLRKTLGNAGFMVAIDLLTVKKFRSSYRESLCMQIRECILDNYTKYKRPLTQKQINSISVYSWRLVKTFKEYWDFEDNR